MKNMIKNVRLIDLKGRVHRAPDIKSFGKKYSISARKIKDILSGKSEVWKGLHLHSVTPKIKPQVYYRFVLKKGRARFTFIEITSAAKSLLCHRNTLSKLVNGHIDSVKGWTIASMKTVPK